MNIENLLYGNQLGKMLEDKYVRQQVHPTAPLAILNYTEKAIFDREWNQVTMACRGLIYNYRTGEVVARPFRKFFNYGEPGAELGTDNESVLVTDKIDGSLGICYYNQYSGQYEIATRGSFTSDQAVHATELLHYKYPEWKPGYPLRTYLFEIVYPENRIVIDYGKQDDLILLATVDTETGYPYPGASYTHDWPGPVTRMFEATNFADALALPPRPNAEGVVVQFVPSGKQVKVKQDDYVRLHRLITGMNARVIWEQLGLGLTADQICQGVPEEFWPWIREVANELETEHARLLSATRHQYEAITEGLPDGWARKDFADLAVQSPFRPWLFLLLDGREPGPAIWATLKPSAERTLVATRTEDAA